MGKIHLNNIMRSAPPALRDKGENLNTKTSKRKRKMDDDHQKEDYEALKRYAGAYYDRENVLRWIRQGTWEPSKVMLRLEKGGYVNYNPDIKVSDTLYSLKYDDRILTNRGYAYLGRLGELHTKDVALKAAIASAICAAISVVFAIFAWLVATGRIK